MGHDPQLIELSLGTRDKESIFMIIDNSRFWGQKWKLMTKKIGPYKHHKQINVL